ncbi:hypothetical protein JG688_00018276 [Phytophthora aleatoria]|uniref:Uncharacterized protein n=1 Tax=Phytophthora aleatoria TaxID=2496075 RepID=A0A8J5HZT1_9STRA|nr:hypothetical protein JG688_00018276 [Phytophthora aleatoria]
MARKLRKAFQAGHDVLYGLGSCQRNPETFRVVSVACRFCIKYSIQNSTSIINNEREQRAHTISISLSIR